MKKKRLRLGAELVFLILCITMGITVIMSVLYYRQAGSSLRKNYRESVQENLTTRADLFDDMMKEAYLDCVNAAMDDRLWNLIDTGTTYEGLMGVLRTFCEKNNQIQSIYCYIEQADVFVKVSSESSQIIEGNNSNHVWLDTVTGKSDADPFTPVFNQSSDFSIRRDYFTFEQKIYDGNHVQIGRLFVNLDERQVYFNCLKDAGPAVSSISITNGAKIVSSSKMNLIGTRVQEEEHTISVSCDMEETAYSILSVSDESVIEDDLQNMRNWIILITILLNLLICIPVFLVVRRLLSPLRNLEEKMNLVMEGDLTVRADVSRSDEIGSLAEHFNSMIVQVEKLIDELVTQKMLKKEAELEALSYQITPHFMYNTLASIRFAAELGEYEEIPELLQAFTELLRMSASDRGAFITVKQELRMVRNYVLLQQFRYKNSFTAEYRMSTDTEAFYVPRLLIQPLVENAVLHGLDHMEKGNHICVSVRKEGTTLKIQVKDNGSGMTQEEVERLLNGEFHSKFSGIGINNIIERLRLYYGTEASLSYRSEPGKGTTAIIILPASDDPDAFVI